MRRSDIETRLRGAYNPTYFSDGNRGRVWSRAQAGMHGQKSALRLAGPAGGGQGKRARSARLMLPASAAVFAAVAVLAVVVAGNGTIAGLFRQNAPQDSQFAAGSQPTATGGVTPQAAAPTQAAAQLAGGGQFLQAVNASGAADGITATVLQAGTDGYALQMTIKAGPFADRTEPVNNLKILIDGKPNAADSREPADLKWEGEPDVGYVTYTAVVPLTNKPQKDTAGVELQFDYGIPDKLYVDDSDIVDESKAPVTHVRFKVSFDLIVCKPEPLAVSGSGKAAYGNDAGIVGVYRQEDFTVFALKLTDDESGDLKTYFDKHKGDEGSTADRVLFVPEDPKKFGIALCDRHVDEEFVKGFSSFEAINVNLAAAKPKAEGLTTWNMLLLERGEGPEYTLYIINVVNPGIKFKLGSEFTVITRSSFNAGSYEASYALQGTIG